MSDIEIKPGYVIVCKQHGVVGASVLADTLTMPGGALELHHNLHAQEALLNEKADAILDRYRGNMNNETRMSNKETCQCPCTGDCQDLCDLERTNLVTFPDPNPIAGLHKALVLCDPCLDHWVRRLADGYVLEIVTGNHVKFILRSDVEVGGAV